MDPAVIEMSASLPCSLPFPGASEKKNSAESKSAASQILDFALPFVGGPSTPRSAGGHTHDYTQPLESWSRKSGQIDAAHAQNVSVELQVKQFLTFSVRNPKK